MLQKSICKIAAIAFATLIQLPAFADDTQVLESISAFAKNNCEEVNQSGDATGEHIKGKVDAGVSGLFKSFASADGQAEIDRDTKKYSGLIQTELASSLKDVRACKQHVIDLLVPRLLKGSQNDSPTLKPTPPMIPDYSSGWVEGGHGYSTNTYCDPQKEAYEKKYPDFIIEMTLHPEDHRVVGTGPLNAFKHDEYNYSCSFAAVAK
jgi:hypothetical protein